MPQHFFNAAVKNMVLILYFKLPVMYNIARFGETKAEVSHVDYLWAFVIGGAICVVGQVLIDFTKMTPARILVLFVTLGVVLTALGLYEPLVKLAGAGATVPLTGFGYTMAKGTMEAVKQHGILGAFSGGLTASAAGIAAAVVFGYLAALLSKPGDKS
jgi:stage V sporulation protein AE